MYVEIVPNRTSPPAILLRESFRQDDRIKKRTLANLSAWPQERIEALRALLRGKVIAPRDSPTHAAPDFEVIRTRPHGHVAAALGSLRTLGLHTLISRSPARQRDIICALIVARILDPHSKLATVRDLRADTLTSSLGAVLSLESLDEDEVYAAMDWLLPQQIRIENQLARRHLKDGTLVLYDLTSTWFEGHTCPLARFGHSRDGKRDKLQIVIGLLCEREGRPIAIEVFDGNTGDPSTLATQVDKVRKRFKISRVVLVGDRGTITAARIRTDLVPIEGMAWITALRAPQIQLLAKHGSLQLSLFDQRDLAEISDPDYPDERLVACCNPLLKQERARKRDALLAATERELQQIVEATQRPRRRLQGKDKIGLRVGRIRNHYKVGKHFVIEITEQSLTYRRDQQGIAEEAALDGVYVIRTSVQTAQLSATETVRAYKDLAVVERAFRSTKTVDLKVRPIYHRLADRVRSHVFLCMLAYYVEWHMRAALAPILFDDDDRQAAAAQRSSIVRPAARSEKALRKAANKITDDGLPVHSFHTLLSDLATIACNTCQASIPNVPTFEKVTVPTALQRRALELLGVSERL
jgi:transposase